MGNSMKSGFHICSYQQQPVGRPSGDCRTNKIILNESSFISEEKEMKELKIIDSLLQSVRLKKPNSRIPIDLKLYQINKTCLKKRSNIKKSLGITNYMKTSQTVITSELTGECSQYSSINIYSSIFSHISSVFSDLPLDHNQGELLEMKNGLCLMLDAKLNSPFLLSFYYEQKEIKSKIEFISRFVEKMGGNLIRRSHEYCKSLDLHDQSNKEEYFHKDNSTSECKDPLSDCSGNTLLREKGMFPSFKKRQVEFKESMPSKINHPSSAINSDINLNSRLHAKAPSAAVSKIHPVNVSINNQSSKHASGTKLLNLHIDMNKVNTELSLIKETKEKKDFNMIKRQNKKVKTVADSRSQVRKSSFKHRKLSNAKVLFNKENLDRHIKYIITFDLRDLAVHQEKKEPIAQKAKIPGGEAQEVKKNPSPKHKLPGKQFNENENSTDLSHFLGRTHHRLTLKKRETVSQLVFNHSSGKLKEIKKGKRESELKSFDKSSLIQPLSFIADRQEALRARLDILEKLKKDNIFLFS